MPHTASASKRLRQNHVRRTRNRARSTELKTIEKHLLRALSDSKPDEAKVVYRQLTKRLDQAAANNVIHKNHASRTKSRLAVRMQVAFAAPAPAAKPAPVAKSTATKSAATKPTATKPA